MFEDSTRTPLDNIPKTTDTLYYQIYPGTSTVSGPFSASIGAAIDRDAETARRESVASTRMYFQQD
jgi:hypothetical protein